MSNAGTDGAEERWRALTRLPMILEALTLSEEDPLVHRLARALGDEFTARERLVGEPAYRSRRLSFVAGGEIILHDDAVVAVLLRVASTAAAHRTVDLSEWMTGTSSDATLDDLKNVLGEAPRFAGIGIPYFAIGGGFVRANFRNSQGWKDAGNLLSLTVTVDKPGLACRPEDDECPTCSDLLVRGANDALDVEGTVNSLAAALTAGALTEDTHWVRLADLRPLHDSGLMARVETQLTCTTCRRILCLMLFRDASPTFGYHAMNDAMRHPLEAIPPVELWGDAARIAEDRNAMHYVDHEPGAWFLVEQNKALYLGARYAVGSMGDDSALIELDETELEAYRAGGHEYLSRLADRINQGSPHRETSELYARNLYRTDDAKSYRDAVAAAIVNHTWLARQRSSGLPPAE